MALTAIVIRPEAHDRHASHESEGQATAAESSSPSVDAGQAKSPPERLAPPKHGATARMRAESVRPAVWKLCCCPGHVCTPQSPSPPDLRVAALHLAFSVSLDEEHVELLVTCGGRTFGLGDRGHNYLLLTLARQRMDDAARGVTESECGWVALEDVEHDRTMSPPRLNMDVHRIRKQFAAVGVIDAEGIIERRTRNRRLRIGVGRLSILKV